MSNFDVVKYFVQQIDWFASAIDATLKRKELPPVVNPPGGKVGSVMDALKELSVRYQDLEKKSGALSSDDEGFNRTLKEPYPREGAEPKTPVPGRAPQVNLQKAERRIEELVLANTALQGHSQYLTDQLTASKASLYALSQVEQRLSLREAEIQQLSSQKKEIEALVEDLKKQIKQMSVNLTDDTQVFQSIAKIGEIVNFPPQPEEVLRRICRVPLEFIGCKRSATYLKDLYSDSFVPVHSSGMSAALQPVFRSSKFREGSTPLLKELISRKRPIAVEDCRTSPSTAKVYSGNKSTEIVEHTDPFLPRDYVERFEICSLLAIPFISKGTVLGIMFVDYGSAKHIFSNTEIAAMKGLAQFTGAALGNIRRYQDSTKRLLDLERQSGTELALRELDETIFSTHDAEKIINSAITMIPRVIGCEFTSVLLVEPNTKSYYVLGNLGNLIQGKETIPIEQTAFNGALAADQVLHRPNLQNENNLSPFDQRLINHGIGSDLVFPISIEGEINGLIHISSRRVAGFSHGDTIIGQKIAAKLAEALQRATARRRIDRRKGNGDFKTIHSLIQIVSQKGFRLGDYRDQMIQCGLDLSKQFKLDTENQGWIKYAIVLLDIGKSTIPDHILNKKDPLTEKELMVLRTHPVQGAEMIRNFRFSGIIEGMKFIKYVVPLVRHTYERWDGTGYPDGLSGEEIPQGARIISVVNASAAMMMDRPYRKALHPEEAIKEIRNGVGRQFDPAVVEHFFRYFQDQNNID